MLRETEGEERQAAVVEAEMQGVNSGAGERHAALAREPSRVTLSGKRTPVLVPRVLPPTHSLSLPLAASGCVNVKPANAMLHRQSQRLFLWRLSQESEKRV